LQTIVLRRKATFTCGVNYQDRLATIGVKAHFIAFVVGETQVVQ